MSSVMLQEWKREPLIDSDLEEWLVNSDDSSNHFKDFPLKSCEPDTNDDLFQDINDSFALESDCCLKELPLFEEIQHLDDVKIQFNPDSQNGLSALDDLNQLSDPLQTLFHSSIENATFVFSNHNFAFIKSDAQPGNAGNLQDGSGKSQDVSLQMIEDLVSGLNCEKDKRDAAEETVENVVAELNRWESDTTWSEVSSNGPTTTFGFALESPKSTPEEGSDDPDWNPNRRKTPATARCQKAKRVPSKTSSHRFWKEETIEDKRKRKKEQNKYAASKYRLKKKEEISKLLKEEEELKQKKMKLKEKVSDLTNEIRCLKGLMREFFKVKGLL